MKKQWTNASVAPQRDGFYEVRVISPGEPEHQAIVMAAEWRDGRWRLETSTGPAALTPDSSWREIWVNRAC